MHAQIELQHILKCIDGNGADQIAVQHRDAILRCLALDCLKDAVDRRLFIVRQIHGHLNDAVPVLKRQRDGANALIAARDRADCLDDLLADLKVLGLEIDIERHQREADTGDP